MRALSIPLSLIGLGFSCWLLYSLAVYALPFFVGLSIAFYAYDKGAGAFGAILLGLLTAGVVLAIGQVAFALARAPVLRILLGLTFAIPAAVAGYHAAFDLAGLTLPSDAWRHVFGVLGAIAIGATAWLRLAPMPANADGHRLPAGS